MNKFNVKILSRTHSPGRIPFNSVVIGNNVKNFTANNKNINNNNKNINNSNKNFSNNKNLKNISQINYPNLKGRAISISVKFSIKI